MAKKALSTEQFTALPRKEKAVLVAKDVLKQIRYSKIKVGKYGYMELILEDADDYELDVQTNLDKIETCKCCLLGACMLSTTKLGNQLTFNQLDNFADNKKALRLLRKIFTPKQMLMLETCFEGYSWTASRIGRDRFEADLTEEERNACSLFYINHGSSEDRVVSAMKNLIKNKGVFIP